MGKSAAEPYVVGPVIDENADFAQSLRDKQRKLSSNSIDAVRWSDAAQDEDRIRPVYNRIHGTRARTPESLARELEQGIKERESATKTETGQAGK